MSWWGKSSSAESSQKEKESEFKDEKVISVGNETNQTPGTTTTTTKPVEKEQPPLPSLTIDPQMEKYMTSCPAKTVMNFFAGGLFGFAFGSFFTLGFNPAIEQIENKRIYQHVFDGFRLAFKNGWSSAKGFSVAGATFTASECVIESYRAKTDIYNTACAGCLSGAILAGRAGAQAAIVGCVGFAAFSSAIDHFTGKYGAPVKHDDTRWTYSKR